MKKEKTARIALEMHEDAVLRALFDVHRLQGKRQTLASREIREIIGTPPYYKIVRDTLHQLQAKGYVERWSEDTRRWYITKEGIRVIEGRA